MIAGCAWLLLSFGATFLGSIVSAAESTAATSAVRIERLLQTLENEDFETREKATQELLGSCLPALDAARSLLRDETSSAEARVRAELVAKTIAHRLRWASFKGGPIVRGLQATLRSEKDLFQTGETLAFELEVKNVSGEAVAFRGIDTKSFHGGLDYDLPDREGPENWINPARVVLRQVSGDKINKEGRMGGGCLQNEKVELKAGKGIVYPLELPPTEDKRRKGTLLVPGEYELSFFFYGKTLPPGVPAQDPGDWSDPLRLPDDLKSNTIRFRVEARPGEEQK